MSPGMSEDAAPEDQPEQVQVRLDKRQRMLDDGIEPYPAGYDRTHSLAEVRTTWPDLEPDQATGATVGVTGRVVFVRTGGKLCFATLRSGDGTELQVMLSLDRVGEQALAAWKTYVDIGDHVGVTGEVVSSRRGELSILADSWAVTAKALRPLPNLYEGAQLSEDLRARQRYVDLIVRADARTMARMRPAVVQSLRITQPLKLLASRADQIARGDLSTRVEVNSLDEIGMLDGALERLADGLAAA